MRDREITTKSFISSMLFVLVFFLLLLYPLAGSLIDQSVSLSGVTETEDPVICSAETVMDGSYQSSLNTWIENHFWGRSAMIKLRSQMLYSFLNESPNRNVVIGKDRYLYEPGYINWELGIFHAEEGYYTDLVDKLESLQELLNQNGKELFLFITPSKAYFYQDQIPRYYNLMKTEKKDLELFFEELSQSSLLYFDSTTYIESYSGDGIDAPVFYPTGIHWSFPWAQYAAKGFSEYITENSKWNLSTLKQNVYAEDEPEWPDADLYQSLNLISEPKGITYYGSELTVVEDWDHPNVFMRGGSFMGQSLSGLVRAGVFGENVHLENNNCFSEMYNNLQVLESRRDYDAIGELPQLMAEMDILILEVNEAAIGDMSFGFIDYLLEHPDYLIAEERK